MQTFLLVLFGLGLTALLVGLWLGAVRLAHSASFLGNKKLQGIAVTVLGATYWVMDKSATSITFENPLFEKMYLIVLIVSMMSFFASILVLVYPGKSAAPVNTVEAKIITQTPKLMLLTFLVISGLFMLFAIIRSNM